MIRGLALAAALLASPVAAAIDAPAIEQAATMAKVSGVILVGEGDRLLFAKGFGTGGTGSPHDPDAVWRWASVTKQLVTLLAMQEVAAGRLDLDQPVSAYWPEWRSPNARRITLRMLMRHESGLPDPSDTPQDANGIPAFYRSPEARDGSASAAAFCAGKPSAEPQAGFRYNNCDFIVLGTLLERTTGQKLATLVQERIAKPLGLVTLGLYDVASPAPPAVPGYDAQNRPEPQPGFVLGSYAGAGAAYGSPIELWKIDRALMENRLLDRVATAAMWTGDPALGYAALGQWSFSAPLKGCADPVAIVERRGAIGGIEIRNFLLPVQRKAVIVFVDHSEFPFGEVWQGKGLSHDLLSAAACPKP